MGLKKGLIKLIGISDRQYIRRIRNVLPYFKIILIAYVVIVLLYIILFGFLSKHTTAFLDNLFGTSFGISFSASLLEDLIIFLLLGFLATLISIIISTKTPAEYVFDDRVKAIMNSEKVQNNNQLFSFLQYNLTTFLAFNSSIKIRIIVEEYNTPKKTFKITTESTVVITNMCSDYIYKPQDPYAYVFPDQEVNGKFGQVSYLGTFDPATGNSKSVLINEQPHEFTSASPYKQQIDLNIEEGGEIGWKILYSIWNQQDDDKLNEKAWFFLWLERYSQSIEVIVENKLASQRALKFDCQRFRKRENDKIPILTLEEIAHNSEKVLPLLNDLYPSDKLEFYFYKP